MRKRDETKEKARAEAKKRLRKMIKVGTTVYTALKKVSTYQYRHIAALVAYKGEIVNISGDVADILGWKWHDDGSVGVSGCGLDTGHHLVMQLSYSLFPRSFTCIGANCPSNDHFNGDRDRTKHKHTSGGYALRQRWI